MCNKQALLEHHHQMFCINSETVRFQLTSRLRNLLPAWHYKNNWWCMLFIFCIINFEIHNKDTQKKKSKWNHFLCNKQALLEHHHQMFCINSETVRFQLTSRFRNSRFQRGITRTIGDAFFLYFALLILKFTKNKDTQKKNIYISGTTSCIINKPYSNIITKCFVSTQKQSTSS